MSAVTQSSDPPETRARFRYFAKVPTRWMDTDQNGHVHQAEYYSFFDTAITTHLIQDCGFDPSRDATTLFCVENMCRYHRELSFPQIAEVGVRVARLGNSSLRYELALFTEGHETASATGYFVYVFVDRQTHRSTPIPPRIRAALEQLKAAP